MWTWIQRLPLLLLLLVVVLVVSNCTMLGFNYASLETQNKPEARPALDGFSRAEWARERERLQRVFQDEVYGPWPEGLPRSIVSQRVVDPSFADGRAVLSEAVLQLGEGEGAQRFIVALMVPAGASAADPAPLIVSQAFSSTCMAFPGAPLTAAPGAGRCPESVEMPSLVTAVFGEFIAEVPADRYLDAGFAYASFAAREIIEDSPGEAREELARLAATAPAEAATPTGALSAWGYGYSAVVDLAGRVPELDASRVAVLGHSRHGKSALLAGAFDPRIAAVLAHQSGYGGAASNRSVAGEGLERMVEGARLLPLLPKLPAYPHWFSPEFSDAVATRGRAAVELDQHQLLALIAPRPVFLGNGRRDVWSDPNSTYRIAEGADPIWELLGSKGLDQAGMQDFRPGNALAYFLRPGGHGIHGSDIDAFLAFAEAHLRKPRHALGKAAAVR